MTLDAIVFRYLLVNIKAVFPSSVMSISSILLSALNVNGLAAYDCHLVGQLTFYFKVSHRF